MKRKAEFLMRIENVLPPLVLLRAPQITSHLEVVQLSGSVAVPELNLNLPTIASREAIPTEV